MTTVRRHSQVRAELGMLRDENASLRREVEGLKALTYLDPVTRLANERYALEKLREELARAERVNDEQCSLVTIAVHDAEEASIKWVARLLQSSARAYDLVGHVGGGRFIVVLPHTAFDGMHRFVARFRGRLGSAIQFREDKIVVDVGSATSGPRDSAEAMLEAADHAMYRDQQFGPLVAPEALPECVDPIPLWDELTDKKKPAVVPWSSDTEPDELTLK